MPDQMGKSCRDCDHKAVCVYLWEIKDGARVIKPDVDFSSEKKCGEFKEKR